MKQPPHKRGFLKGWSIALRAERILNSLLRRVQGELMFVTLCGGDYGCPLYFYARVRRHWFLRDDFDVRYSKTLRRGSVHKSARHLADVIMRDVMRSKELGLA